MTKRARATLSMLVAGAVLFALAPAHAHTDFVIAGFQITQGGYVNVPGNDPIFDDNLRTGVDGTVRWTNLDPIEHRLVECNAACTTPRSNPRLDLTLAPGEIRVVNVNALVEEQNHNKFLQGKAYTSVQRRHPDDPFEVIEYFDPAYPWMRGQLWFTSGH